MASTPPIHDVSETALWVAHFRAQESERPDALFCDPYAAVMAGERGAAIANSMSATSAHTRLNVVMRTKIIDDYLTELIVRGTRVVLNMGAGLDSRPYRMDLPPDLQWVEVDFPKMIEFKSKALQRETPHCRLERVSMDLSDRQERREFLRRWRSTGESVVVLTEGVLPYLSLEEVDSLSRDLQETAAVRHWICDYMDPRIYRFLKSAQRRRQMQNAPFRFFPPDWLGFFRERGWRVHTLRYLQEEALKLGRKVPMPWWARLFGLMMPPAQKRQMLRASGYMILERGD